MPLKCRGSATKLPRSWNRSVRSAVLHAVSLAHYAITCDRVQAIQTESPVNAPPKSIGCGRRLCCCTRSCGLRIGGWRACRRRGGRIIRRWCRRRSIGVRYGAVGRHGSIAIVERFIRTLKESCTRRLLVPLKQETFQRELNLFADWFNEFRPHAGLNGRTPNEVYFARFPATRHPRYEPRPRWPRGSPCAKPRALVRGRPGAQLELHVDYHAGRRHLPVVTLRRAA